MRLINADILEDIKSPVKEDYGDYDVRAFRKGWNMAIETIMENAPAEPVIDRVLEVINWRISLLGNTVADGLIKQELDIIKTTIIKELKGGEQDCQGKKR